ncbi:MULTISPECIES: ABC transporter substrate-binding protein [unclassified Rhodococcus (in: high G+C Gram-positive bacteria)]|uniref:ABC transporter substrate-binding protein n=1 Tax=unclassified Rhodococcus (in: high G+C Gram-positive bacteria) TaxID=192944 RepID=UPI00163A2634|nr:MULTISPECIES: ABC transporter substrate-binding protein [unclassified Rhodococcus (in: high G+C Gram-positive bacteria)]MBC2641281.1 peptide ABC transporter substrate-binding protein [Rhodococcus sp. 3A]MBC2893974.1 peptide ABC transporter substrate-binding protein [Rhodococcus sp. 4CII]
MSPARSLQQGTRYRVVVAATAAITVPALVTGCSVANSSHSDAASPDTLRIVLPQEPPTLEPCDASLTSTGVVVRSNITEPLVERNADTGYLEPKLADSWEQTSPTVWTFRIHPGVTFSDGSAFDAEDAAFSIDRTVNSSIGCDVDGYVFGDDALVVKAVDPMTVTVETPAADPILPLRISFVEMVPTTTSSDDKVRDPIGTGPYKVDYWDHGQRLSLVRNDTYWGEAPEYARAIYQWRTEGSVRAAMVVNGEAELATSLGPEDGAGDLGAAYPNNETTALRIDGTQAPLDDYRVREAIDLSVNRPGIVKALFQGLGEPAGQLVGSSIVGFDPDLEPTEYDPDRAARLVAEAKADGVPVDRQIRLIGRTGQFPKINETVEVIQNSLSKAGLDVKIEMMDTAAQLQYQVRPYPQSGPVMLVIQHGNQAGDAQFTVDQYMRSDGYQSYFGTPGFDAQIDAAENAVGEARQNAFADVLANEPKDVRQFAYIAHMNGVLAKSPTVAYTPNSATGDEMRLSEMTHADAPANG